MHLFRRKGKVSEAPAGTAPRIQPLSEDHVKTIQDRMSLLEELIAAYSPPDVQRKIIPDVLDRTYSNWIRSDPEAARHAPTVIDALGAGLGNYLNDQLMLEWVIAEDDFGTDFAVFGQPNDVLVFPSNLIAKRYDRGEERFIQDLALTMVQGVRHMRRGQL